VGRSAPEEFLARPGLSGPFGALMDEYARAAEDFCRVLEGFPAARFAAERPSDDPDCRSPRAIARHACGAARRYADYVRRARGLPYEERFELGPAALATPGEARGLLRDALRYTEGALDGFYDASYEANRALEFPVRWGPRYDPEMLLEHAIVHLLRHRRQLERWETHGGAGGTPSAP
jgi:hypothetical protein